MVMKKLGVFAVFLFFMILFLGFVSAASCSIQSSCNTANTVMKLSGTTNAHGELWDQDNYEYALCCDFEGGDRTCSLHLHPEYDDNVPTNKIIGLSFITNAHAETPNETNYETEVCYGSFPEYLVCINTTESCSGDYPMGVLSLSDYTNAHIGAYGDYDINICCEMIECRGDVLFCSNYDENECKVNPCNVAEASVEANDESGEITCGEGYDCLCWWDKLDSTCEPLWYAIEEPKCGDGEIDSSLSEECDGTDWGLITGCDNSDDAGLDDYTGGILSCKSDCTFDVSQCTGGVTGGFCGDDIIQSPNDDGFYETCDNDSLSGKTCADFGLCEDGGLACYPPEHTNNCTFNTTGCVACESHPSKIGKCNYDESTDDNCDDNFLTYSWTATWTWDPENIFDVNPNGEDYIIDDGKWHYDPNEKYKKCIGGSNTVPCPAQIQLPFFGSYSIVVILVLIALIYVILTWKKKKFNSKGKVKKK